MMERPKTETAADWCAWARRETAAFMAEHPTLCESFASYEDAIVFGAALWLQGVNLGAHETLHAAEDALKRVAS